MADTVVKGIEGLGTGMVVMRGSNAKGVGMGMGMGMEMAAQETGGTVQGKGEAIQVPGMVVVEIMVTGEGGRRTATALEEMGGWVLGTIEDGVMEEKVTEEAMVALGRVG